MFFWNSLAFSMIQQMLAVWSLVLLPFLPSLDFWKFLVSIMQKPSMQNFSLDLTSMEDESNCPMISTFFSTTLLGNWDEDWAFPVLWLLLGLPDLLTFECNTLMASSFRVLNSSARIPSHLLALFTAVIPKAHLTSVSRMSGWLTTPS